MVLISIFHELLFAQFLNYSTARVSTSVARKWSGSASYKAQLSILWMLYEFNTQFKLNLSVAPNTSRFPEDKAPSASCAPHDGNCRQAVHQSSEQLVQLSYFVPALTG
jgi:hypothetical protein